MGCAHEGVCCYVFSSQRTTDSEGIKKNKSEIVVKWNKSQSLITIKHMTYDDHNTKMSYALLYYSFIVILMRTVSQEYDDFNIIFYGRWYEANTIFLYVALKSRFQHCFL